MLGMQCAVESYVRSCHTHTTMFGLLNTAVSGDVMVVTTGVSTIVWACQLLEHCFKRKLDLV